MSDSDEKKRDKLPLLKGTDNYHSWIRRIRVKLAGKGLLKISTFQIPEPGQPNFDKNDFGNRIRAEPKPVPDDPEELEEDIDLLRAHEKEVNNWERKYYKALSIILDSIHPNLQGEFDKVDDPAILLCTIENLYSHDEVTTEVELREQLFNLKFDLHQPADDFFAKVQHLHNRLAGLNREMDRQDKITILYHILKNPELVAFKDSLIARVTKDTTYSEVVTIFKAFIRRKQEELNIDTSYYVQGGGSSSGRGRGRGRGRGGFSNSRGRGGSSGTGYGRGNQTGSGDNSTRKCYGCQQFGHVASECPHKADNIKRLKERIRKMEEEGDKDKDKEVKRTAKTDNNDEATAAKKARKVV